MASKTKQRSRYSADDFRAFRTKPMFNIPGLVFTRDGLDFERRDIGDSRAAFDEGVRIGIGLLAAIRQSRAQGDRGHLLKHLQLMLEPVEYPLTVRTEGFLRVLERALEVFVAKYEMEPPPPSGALDVVLAEGGYAPSRYAPTRSGIGLDHCS